MAYYIKIIKYIVALSLIGVGIVFGINNQGQVSIELYPIANAIQVPSYIALFASFFLGSVIAILFFGMEYFKKSLKTRGIKKELDAYKRQTPMTIEDNQATDVPIS